jgi:hypothetical protein
MNGGQSLTTGPMTATVPNAKTLIAYPPSDADCDLKQPEYDQKFEKVLSKGILRKKIEEFENGKYSKKYIDTYLEFVHLEGVITNLEYLQFREQLKGSL